MEHPKPDAKPPLPDPQPAARGEPVRRRPPSAPPFARGELAGALRNPGHTLEVALGDGPRLCATIDADRSPWRLVGVLTACAAAAALPYGLALGAGSWWKIAALYGGSVLLCWPSLQVFGTYLGSRRQPVQSLALAFVIASAAALFTCGFAPIFWFLCATMQHGDWIDAADASALLLALAFAGGLRHGFRCFTATEAGMPRALAFTAWLALVVFVTWRMARTLALLP